MKKSLSGKIWQTFSLEFLKWFLSLRLESLPVPKDWINIPFYILLNWTYCGDHLIIQMSKRVDLKSYHNLKKNGYIQYTTESLCYTPETTVNCKSTIHQYKINNKF